ncbi:uncharacterized protein SAPINGB_P003806 [Magnusiomyces paraingens]|uniref:HTH CENPB-type domain-containing protein n=1 Tax=Magnusiomyces paraingens TaxID=2606893 RepID=A0A5E8BTF6_9ASCO|nr:uncharacterized protein SAPINGB_P003806 [Saprochaete ingens]VVT53899.1 unnamed protein product [Saprochaete ingens]
MPPKNENRELLIAEALKLANMGTLSIRKSAQTFGLCPSTLTRRHHGASTSKKSHARFQKLDPKQENELAQRIRARARIGQPLINSILRQLAFNALHQNSPNATLGNHWTESFLRRYPDLKITKAKDFEPTLRDSADPAAVRKFQNMYLSRKIQNIKPENIYNVDETSFDESNFQNLHVFIPQETKSYLKVYSGRKWITVIECVRADGTTIPPFFIFADENTPESWIDSVFDSKKQTETWGGGFTKKGWVERTSFTEWAKTIFFPNTVPLNPSEPRLLFLDGHPAHRNPEFLKLCFDNNTFVLFLPPQSSHFLQPLDVAGFPHLKKLLAQNIEINPPLFSESLKQRADFIDRYCDVRPQAFSKEIVDFGWYQTGLWPFQRIDFPECVMRLTEINSDYENAKKGENMEYTWKPAPLPHSLPEKPTPQTTSQESQNEPRYMVLGVELTYANYSNPQQHAQELAQYVGQKNGYSFNTETSLRHSDCN